MNSKLEVLALQGARLNCQLKILQDSTKHAWDQFNLSLSSQFPETTSEYIRSKMLEMRNAELIRMFQTFDSLPEPIKTELNKIEEVDASIVSEVESIQRRLDSIEMDAIKVFMKMEERFPDSLTNYRNRYRLLSDIKNCN